MRIGGAIRAAIAWLMGKTADYSGATRKKRRPRYRSNAVQCREVSDVIKIVAAKYRVSPGLLKSDNRTAYTVRVRNIAVLVAKRTTGKPQRAIAPFFKRSHHAINYALRNAKKEYLRNKQFRDEIDSLVEEASAHLRGRP